MKWYIKCFKQYADFKGRARRKEYWLFTLFNILVLTALLVLDYVIGWADDTLGFGVLYALYAIMAFIPSLAVCIRRLHDIGKSGWNYLFVLIPIVGAILMIVWFCTAGDAGENRFGDDPKIGSGFDKAQI